MNQKALETALSGLNLGNLRYLDRTGSTNDDASRWAAAGAPDLSLVLADEQTAGRGRMQRRWFTPPNSALAFSLVLKPRSGNRSASENNPVSTGRLAGLGALAIREALWSLYNIEAEVKWPNDVLVGGRKLAGILVEAHWQDDHLAAAILGIGINVASSAVPPQEALHYPATCVEAWLEPGQRADRLVLLGAVLERILAWRPELGSEAFLRAWEAALAFRGQAVHVTTDLSQAAPSGNDFTGLLLGLAPDGALRIQNPSGREVQVRVGEIRLA